jgi:hypothetical protein
MESDVSMKLKLVHEAHHCNGKSGGTVTDTGQGATVWFFRVPELQRRIRLTFHYAGRTISLGFGLGIGRSNFCLLRNLRSYL